MNKLERAARQLLSVLESGMIDINAVTALREALDHSGEANEMVQPVSQEPVKRFTSDDVKVAFENGYAAAMSVADIAKEVEQEPVGWYKPSDFVLYRTKPDDVFVYIPLYAAPVRTKDLTDDEIAEIFSKYASDLYKARAVIAADREKNK